MVLMLVVTHSNYKLPSFCLASNTSIAQTYVVCQPRRLGDLETITQKLLKEKLNEYECTIKKRSLSQELLVMMFHE